MRGLRGEPDSLVLGIDLGGTKIAAGVVRADGAVLSRAEVPTLPAEGPQAVVRRMGRLAREVAGERWSEIKAVGLGCPGPLDQASGTVLFAPNLTGWFDVPIRDLLAQELDKHVGVENDANAAALGEARFGSGEPVSHLLYVTVSTGIGGGVVVDHQPYRGAFGGAAEIGHITMQVDGPRCGCGRRGCLEAISSGTGISRAVREALEAGADSLVREIVGDDPSRVDARAVAEAASRGDALCAGVLENAFKYLGVGIANAVNLFDPAVVVIGGGVSRIGEPLFAAVRHQVSILALPPGRDRLIIKPASLGADSGLIGAAASVMAF